MSAADLRSAVARSQARANAGLSKSGSKFHSGPAMGSAAALTRRREGKGVQQASIILRRDSKTVELRCCGLTVGCCGRLKCCGRLRCCGRVRCGGRVTEHRLCGSTNTKPFNSDKTHSQNRNRSAFGNAWYKPWSRITSWVSPACLWGGGEGCALRGEE